MSKVKFSVIIISWRVISELDKCLASLEHEVSSQADFNVVVVDNASNDGTVEMVQKKFPWVTLIPSAENLGFAKACNLAVSKSPAEYYVFLNPDTEITVGFFSDLERSFLHHEQAGIVGGHIFNPDGTTQNSVRGFPGLWVGLLEGLKLLGRFPYLASGYLKKGFDYSYSQPVDQVMGACFAVRSKIWLELGGFDEKFFVWFEEVDFCHRAQLAGYEIWYDHNISLIHNKASSFSQLPTTKRHEFFTRSLVYYLKKNVGPVAGIIVWLASRPVFIVTYIYDVIVKQD